MVLHVHFLIAMQNVLVKSLIFLLCLLDAIVLIYYFTIILCIGLCTHVLFHSHASTHSIMSYNVFHIYLVLIAQREGALADM